MSPNDIIAATANLLSPGHASLPADELLVIANEYVEAGRLDAGERLAGHVLRVLPNAGQALQLMGLIAFRRGRHSDAASFIERGIAAGSVNHTQWRNLSEIYRTLTRLDEALAAARRAIALDPADPLNFFNLSMVLFDRLELDAAISATRAALDLNPKLPEAHMKLAQILLTKGEFAEGWKEYEWRYQIPGAAPLMPPTDKPHWDGKKLDGKLLLIGDQGYGDVIQFMRYLPWVRSVTDDIVIASSQELAGIVAQADPGIQQFHRWEDIPPIAAYCSLSGLPRLHGTTLETIPQAVPYLKADPALAVAWKARLDARLPAGLKRVGIAWAGRPTHNNDINRTVALNALKDIGDVPGVALVSLQKGPAAAQANSFAGKAPILNLDAEIKTFEDTLAIIDGLDLLITVDTSVAHMAGAMGKPTWIMLPVAPDFRWLLGRTDSPWYPTIRLFRHHAPRRWDLLVPEVAQALGQFVTGAA